MSCDGPTSPTQWSVLTQDIRIPRTESGPRVSPCTAGDDATGRLDIKGRRSYNVATVNPRWIAVAVGQVMATVSHINLMLLPGSNYALDTENN